jgi:hypothetical protein
MAFILLTIKSNATYSNNTMRLENLNSSKFEAFKGDQLLNMYSVIGGRCYASAGGGNEHYTTGCTHADANGHVTQILEDGELKSTDWATGACPLIGGGGGITNAQAYEYDGETLVGSYLVDECEEC